MRAGLNSYGRLCEREERVWDAPRAERLVFMWRGSEWLSL